MKKQLLRKVLLFLAACVLLYSCRIEDDLIAEKNSENKARKFRALTSKDGEPVNYSHGFKYLLERYDKLHGTESTRKTVLKNNKFAGKNTPEFIEFNIHSQDLIRNNGTERWIMYPVIKNNEVGGIAIAILKEEETNLQFWRLDEKDPYYKEVIGLFRMQYNKVIMKQGLSNRKPCGTEGEEPCEIPEVIITVPGNGPGNDPWMYKPTLGQGGGGYCQTYGNCYGDSGNDDGGGGDPSNPPADSTNTPCEKVAVIGKNEKTKNLFKNLKGKTTSSNSEHGYILDKTGNTINETYVQGEPGEEEIKFHINAPADGFIHSHYQGLLSVFSVRDMFALAQMYKYGSIKDMNTFVIGVVTASGTQYMMVIDDPVKFAAFADNLFIGKEISDIALNAYEFAYKNLYGITTSNSSEINEKSFYNYLETNKAGLKILEGDSTFSDWNVLTKDANGNIVPEDCP